jgi:Na+:H+ antiporter, NhaA family
MGLGILLGLLIGKQLGIFLMAWISVKVGLSNLPENTRWLQIIGLGVLAGIGFTMSIFIAMLSYSHPHFQSEAKFVILVTSLMVGLTSYLILRSITAFVLLIKMEVLN